MTLQCTNSVNKELKMTKCSFKSKAYIASDIVELFHTDLSGPIGIKGYYGDQYFIPFLDDYSWRMSVMFRKVKADVFLLFK